MRIFLKFLATTIFARPDHSTTRVNELDFLAQTLRSNIMEHQDLALAMVNHWNEVATSEGDAAIWVGGMLTHLATKFGFVDHIIEKNPNCLLDYNFLRNANYLTETNLGYDWRFTSPYVPGLQTITLPSLALPPLEKDQDTYILHGPQPQPHPEPQPHPVPPPPVHQPSVPHPEYQFSPFEQQMLAGQQQLLAGMAALNVNYDSMDRRITSLDERVGRLESDTRAALGPMYGYFDQQGWFGGAPVVHPTWYDPARWGGFGAGSSGAGGSSRSGPTGGDAGNDGDDGTDGDGGGALGGFYGHFAS